MLILHAFHVDEDELLCYIRVLAIQCPPAVQRRPPSGHPFDPMGLIRYDCAVQALHNRLKDNWA
eukprot:6484993-Amphidinium_carterae.2